MARRETLVTIDSAGRDLSKIFKITEMSADRAEAWAYRLLLALAKAGVDVPEDFFSMSMAGVAALGIRAMGGLQWDVAKPLLDEMMSCVQIQPPSGIARAMFPGDIEEVGTYIRLREEVVALHTGFSVTAFLSELRATAVAEAPKTEESGPSTAMSERL